MDANWTHAVEKPLSSFRGGARPLTPSAASKDMLVERFQALASEVLVHPVHELVGR